MIIKEEELAHYGTPRHSGRYPWGSGEGADQRHLDFLSTVDELKGQGLSGTDIAKAMGMTTTEFRALNSIAVNAKKASQISQATRLKDTGMSNSAIGREMGINESSVRSLLVPTQALKIDRLTSTANVLRDAVAEKKYIDVGAGVEHFMGVSRSQLNTALQVLKDEGYRKHYVNIPQLGTNHETTLQVLAGPGVTPKEVWHNRDKIAQIMEYSADNGRTFTPIVPPTSIKSSRVAIIWKEDGGAAADGVIYIRPGVKDTTLGGKNYAQVRIAVDDTHFLKGMAMYKDDLPKGVDLAFNTNKSRADAKGDKFKAMKEMEKRPDGSIDTENPFKAVIRRQNGVMNIVNEEGHWEEWGHDFSSQFLSKQSPKLAQEQLNMTYESKKNQLDEIMSLTNPTVRRKLLEEFADTADSAAVHLKAASLPRTVNHAILPLKNIKENEIYAPNFNNGDRVALVRHPHGGIFEIPELIVNNKNREGRATLGPNAKDAVGIHPKVAEKLSGADFDGDNVLVIRNNSGKVKSSPSLAALKDFDPKLTYKKYDGMHVMTPHEKQQEMGNISNLITDMTIKGASQSEIARAVRHSMVVIDAEKHELNYKQSEIDNGIKALKTKWQGGPTKGASTLISKASSEQRVPERKQWTPRSINPATGEKVFKETGRTFVDKNGKLVVKKQMSTKLAETSDANTLSSGTPIEKIYADHSNRLKAMANLARKEAFHTDGVKYSPSAAKAYASEVASLKASLRTAQRNAPLERQAQVIGNAIVRAKKADNPGMDPDVEKKIKSQALEEARVRTGANAKKTRVEISPEEWKAIQAGAISPSMLREILQKTDIDVVKQYATPRQKTLMTSAKKNRATSMLASGYTQSEVADALGVSLTTLKTELSKG